MSIAAICCVGMALPVVAAPPTTRLGASPGPAVNAGVFGGVQVLAKIPGVSQALPSRLDLRPPSDEFGEVRGAGIPATDHFESRRGQRQDRDTSDSSVALGSGTLQAHPLGLAQGMAERFHREGLPVARLWENHSALVSLGLNQKGKPGIWLVQKTH